MNLAGASLEALDWLVALDRLDSLETLDGLEILEALDKLESLDWLWSLERREFLACLAYLAFLEKLVCPAFLAHLERGLLNDLEKTSKDFATASQLGEPLLLPEDGRALSDDLRFLSAVPSEARRPHGRPDGSGGT